MTESDNKPGRGRPRKFSKADVADVAMHAYWEAGPTGVSLNAICARAGISKPSIYRDFGNDDGLAAAALETYAQTVLSEMLAITGGDAPFRDKIRQVATLAAEDRLHENGCLFVKMRDAQAQLGPKTRALIAQIEDIATQAFAEVLAEGRASGEWPGEVSVALGARYLQAQIGLALAQRARGENPREVLDLALSALLGPPSPA